MDTAVGKTLEQKYLNERREFRLDASRIRLYVKDMDGEVETFIEYETITPQKRSIVQQDGRLYIAAISLGIFGLVGLVLNFAGIGVLMRWTPLWIVASLIFFGFHFVKRRLYLLVDLTTNKSIFFLQDRPSKAILDQFLSQMYDIQKSYMRKTYFVHTPGSDIDSEMRKFQWLFKQGFISEVELQQMRATMVTSNMVEQSSLKSERILH